MDWRGDALARIRKLIHEADPDVVEEWKWGVPVWSHDGILCTGESYKAWVKLPFPESSSPSGPERALQLQPGRRASRTFDIREGDTVDAAAFKALIR